MNIYKFKPVLSSIIAAVIEITVLFMVADILFKTKGYRMNDSLFIGGIVSVIVGILSSMSRNSKGLSILSMGRNDASITGSNNLRITGMENKNFKDYFKCAVSFTFNAISLIICGIICVILNFII